MRNDEYVNIALFFYLWYNSIMVNTMKKLFVILFITFTVHLSAQDTPMKNSPKMRNSH